VAALAEQFRVLKLKLGSGDLGLDLATVSVARRAAPEAELILDVNGGWDPTEAPMMIWKLMDDRPALVEQPIHHRHGPQVWEELRAELPGSAPPLYADESVRNAADVARFASCIGGVNVKLLKCGGFDGAVEMIAAAREHGLGVLLGCMIETSLGTTAAAHLAPWADRIDLDGHFYVANDDYEGIVYDREGRLVMPRRPGIGAVPR
jgi:L-alanine-DL-glutamate epimerase-like enolase superfamily enzyme